MSEYKPHPLRRQRKRTKGWKMEPGGVCVTRPWKFGNPFTVKDAIEAGFVIDPHSVCVRAFREWVNGKGDEWWMGEESERRRKAILEALPELRGNLIYCFCELDQPCHGDVLATLANQD